MIRYGTALAVLLLAILSETANGAPRLAIQGKTNRFAGTPGVSSPGEKLDIHFSNPSLKNTTVAILLFDDDGHEMSVNVKLDDKGKGTKTIPTPNWDIVILTQSTSDAHGIIVLP